MYRFYFLIFLFLFSCKNDSILEHENKVLITNKPTGIYVLSNGNSTDNIRDYDFITGYTLRFHWKDFETSADVFDFTIIDTAISQLQGINKKLTLELLVHHPPQHVIDNAGETWSFSGENPVPWDENSLLSWKNAIQVLANHLVPLSNGTMVTLANHPTLAIIDAPIMGLSGIRDLSGQLINLPSYNRLNFINAIFRSVKSMRNAFPNKYGFLAIFGMDDNDTTSPLDEEIINKLNSEFNGTDQLTLGYFQELLSDVGPSTSGIGHLLNMVSGDTYILFQALTSWTNPFRNPDKVASGNPATGIKLGFNNFGARYFELYISDIDNESLWEDYRTWNEIIKFQ